MPKPPRDAVSWVLLLACPLGACSAVSATERSGIAAQAARLAPLYEAIRADASSWPDWEKTEFPVVVRSSRGALLFGSRPRAGFSPIHGDRCPCWRRGVGSFEGAPDGSIWLIGVQGARPWRTDFAPLSLDEKDLVALVVTRESGWIGGAVAAHELFHLYERQSRPLSNGFPHFASFCQKPYRRANEARLLLEQRHLATLLRESTAARGPDLAAWAAERRALVADQILGAVNDDRELVEGLATCFELEVASRALGGRAEAERRLARWLDLGGRNLSADLWFTKHRPYATGAAMCLLLDDGWPGWKAEGWPGGALSARLFRRVGSSDRAIVADRELPPAPLALSEMTLEVAEETLSTQASGILRLEPPLLRLSPIPDSHLEFSVRGLVMVGSLYFDGDEALGSVQGLVEERPGRNSEVYLFGPRARAVLDQLAARAPGWTAPIFVGGPQWSLLARRAAVSVAGKAVRVEVGRSPRQAEPEEGP